MKKNRIINIFALDFDLCGWPSIGASAGFHIVVGGSPCGPGKCQVKRVNCTRAATSRDRNGGDICI